MVEHGQVDILPMVGSGKKICHRNLNFSFKFKIRVTRLGLKLYVGSGRGSFYQYSGGWGGGVERERYANIFPKTLI